MLIFIIAMATAIIGFMAGSLWLFCAAVGFIVVKMHPVLLVIGLLIGLGLLVFRYYWRE